MAKVPLPTLRRLPYYYNILCQMEESKFKYISSAMIANQLGIDDTQVRKDIASIGYMGRPKVGFNTSEFKEHLEDFLGMKIQKEVILIGAGNLGASLSKYEGFVSYGLNIVALFDNDPEKIGKLFDNKEVYPLTKLESIIKKRNIKMAVITTPAKGAQEVANIITKAGVKAIWNFAPTLIKVPDDVFVWNENLAASFITLSQFIAKKEDN